MSRKAHPMEALVRELEATSDQSALIRRLIADYPEELTMEVVTAALRRGLISPGEAIRMVRECNFSFGQTFGALALLGKQRGWQPHQLVVETLQGQPH